jgi:hypothetical protein
MRTAPRPGPVLGLVWPAKERGHRADGDASTGVSRPCGGLAADDRGLTLEFKPRPRSSRPAGKSAGGGCSGPGSPGAGVFRMSW